MARLQHGLWQPVGAQLLAILGEHVALGAAGAGRDDRPAGGAGDQLPGTAKTALFVTVDFATLRDQLVATGTDGDTYSAGAGTVVGTPAAGLLVAPETIRRLACDAELIPAVLGSHGELLDLGTSARLFTKAQTRALWLRDGHCSFPKCAAPAHWCDAHHVVHWADGGPTDLDNATLPCQRPRMTGRPDDQPSAEDTRDATLQPSQGPPTLPHGSADRPDDPGASPHHAPPHLEWDLTPGSYDRALRQRHHAA